MIESVAITGHTSGLGQALFSKCMSPIGFSRSNGFNISTSADRLKIINAVRDTKIFINNAHCNYNQTDMLYELFDVWKDKDKLIINIGSETTAGIKTYAHQYAAQKAALDKASEQLSHLNTHCKVLNIRFGWIGTQHVVSNNLTDNYIDVTDAAEFVLSQAKWANKYKLTTCLLRP
jgi:NAD(P)-dependent dehydrogenase (short-subunit alcohol dehydrogenase family)